MERKKLRKKKNTKCAVCRQSVCVQCAIADDKFFTAISANFKLNFKSIFSVSVQICFQIMNRFVTRSKPTQPTKRVAPAPASGNEENIVAPEPQKTLEEPSVMEKLQHAIREKDAQFTFDILSKNRPFDQAMNVSFLGALVFFWGKK